MSLESLQDNLISLPLDFTITSALYVILIFFWRNGTTLVGTDLMLKIRLLLFIILTLLHH